MSLNKVNNTRTWPNFGPRRNNKTNIEESDQIAALLDYDNAIPVEVDIRVDMSQSLNKPIVREFTQSQIDGINARPTIHGQSVHGREDFELTAPSGKVHRNGNLTNHLAGTLACQASDMLQIAQAVLEDNNAPSDWGIPNRSTSSSHMNYIFARPAMNEVTGTTGGGIGSFGLAAARASDWNGGGQGMAAKELVQMFLTGTASVSSYENPQVLSWIVTKLGNGNRKMTETNNISDASTTDKQHWNANLDYMVLSSMYTSFNDFVIDWKDSIESLSLNLPYLKGEFSGFFERGMKSHFWQRFSTRELVLMVWMIQLGMAKRRGVWQENIHVLPTSQNLDSSTTIADVLSLAGTYHPFCMRLKDMSYDAGPTVGTTLEFIAPGLLNHIDDFSVDPMSYADPFRNMYQEDLLTGLDIVMAEASREMGYAWSSISRGAMEFFSDAKEGVTPDIRTDDARLDIAALRTGWLLGYTDLTDVPNSTGVGSGLKSHWSRFSARGGVIETDEQDRFVQDLKELSTLDFLSGPYFKEGMQKMGASTTTVSHRQDGNGSDHSIKVNLDPESKYGLLNYLVEYRGVNKASSGWPTSSKWPARRRLTFTGISTPEGYHVYANNFVHSLAHIETATAITNWTTLIANVDLVKGVGRGVNHLVNGDGKLINLDRYSNSTATASNPSHVMTIDGVVVNALPLFGQAYYDFAADGWFPSLMKVLTRTYERWNAAKAQVPFKSNWSGSALESVNLAATMTLTHGESIFQSSLRSLIHSAYCGTHANGWHMSTRIYDRQLSDEVLHKRPARRHIGEVGMDLVASVLPEGQDEASYLQGLAMLDILILYAGNHGSSTGVTHSGKFANWTKSRTNRVIDFYPENFGSTVIGSNVRTFYLGEVLSDGTVMSKRVTPMYSSDLGTIRNVSNDLVTSSTPLIACSLDSEYNDYNLQTSAAVFDFYDEDVTVGFGTINAAHCVPGMRYLYLLYPNLNPATVTGTSNSPCGLFGMGDTLTTDGTILGNNKSSVAMTGYATAPLQLINTVNAYRTGLGLTERDAAEVTSTLITRFDTELYLEYVGYMKGYSTKLSTSTTVAHRNTDPFYVTQHSKYSPQIIVIDQDVFDSFTRWLSIIEYLKGGTVNAFSNAHAIINADGGITYNDSFSTSSLATTVAMSISSLEEDGLN